MVSFVQTAAGEILVPSIEALADRKSGKPYGMQQHMPGTMKCVEHTCCLICEMVEQCIASLPAVSLLDQMLQASDFSWISRAVAARFVTFCNMRLLGSTSL